MATDLLAPRLRPEGVVSAAVGGMRFAAQARQLVVGDDDALRVLTAVHLGSAAYGGRVSAPDYSAVQP